MTKGVSSSILGKLPKSTPSWAVGLVTIIVSVATSFGGLYLVVHNELESYLSSRVVLEGKKIDSDNSTLSSVLNLIQNNSAQISDLSSSLYKAQDQSYKLSERISVVEKDLALSQDDLANCQIELKKCKGF